PAPLQGPDDGPHPDHGAEDLRDPPRAAAVAYDHRGDPPAGLRAARRHRRPFARRGPVTGGRGRGLHRRRRGRLPPDPGARGPALPDPHRAGLPGRHVLSRVRRVGLGPRRAGGLRGHGEIPRLQLRDLGKKSADMNRRRLPAAILSLSSLLSLPSLLGCHRSDPPLALDAGAQTRQARIFMIALDRGAASSPKAGCGGNAKAVEVELPVAAPALRGSLEALLAAGDRYESAGLYNSLAHSPLRLERLERTGAAVRIYLDGY